MTSDPFAEFKAAQREGWATFSPTAMWTTVPAAELVEFAGVAPGERVLDVACGTGVVAVSAALRGARVRGLDLSPVLLEEARQNARVARVDVELVEGDVEALPDPDASHDVVLSQFGHLFAPRPEVAVAEMLRVLRPGGRIAFSTWPPEHFVGQLFTLLARHRPPPPGVVPNTAWGEPAVVRERLGDRVRDLHFDRGTMRVPAISAAHVRAHMERNSAPVMAIVAGLQDAPDALQRFRDELEALASGHLAGNVLRQSFLLTRATKREG